MTTLLEILLVIGMVLCIPLLISAALLLHVVDKNRMRKTATSFSCIKCGTTLGVASLQLADDARKEYMRELRRQHPGVRLRVVRTLHAVCPACGTRYTFRKADRTFLIELPQPSNAPL